MGGDRGACSALASRVARWIGTVSIGTVVVGVFGFRLTYNSTESLPVGIYQVRELRGAPRRGDAVGLCLEGEIARLALGRGYVHRQSIEGFVYGARCRSGAAVIGKAVMGVPGDTVRLDRDGVWINGRQVRRGRVARQDRRGRGMPHAEWGSRILGPDEFWVQSSYSERSFDSRYFGPVDRRQIRDLRVPKLVGATER